MDMTSSNPHLLLVESEASLLSFCLLPMLTQQGWHVQQCAAALLTQRDYLQADLIITDVTTPSTLTSWLKCKMLPILVVNADTSTTTKVAFLDAGAKDYLSTPFAKAEFLARLRALLRTTKPTHVLQRDDFCLDLLNQTVKYQGRLVTLTQREFYLLHYLLSHPNKICPRTELLTRVWGQHAKRVVTRTIDAHVNQLRNKLGVDYFHCARGVGYGYRPPLSEDT
ncbi:response regulator transcription factor [Vibrio parahaemolyticus]|nr:response regulator transcription factor [Vibrio parahaemolyticus]